MRTLLFIAALLSPLAALADELPAALRPLTVFTRVSRIDNLTAGTTVYRTTFCLDDCDAFEAGPDDVQALADFSVLYAVYYMEQDYYTTDTGAGLPKGTNEERMALASAAMARNKDKYGCHDYRCVMDALFAAKLKFYALTGGDYEYEGQGKWAAK
jgi:hypothetical protein